MADNYRQAPQKCQYVKVGAVREMNRDKWQSLSEGCCSSGSLWLPASVTRYSDNMWVKSSNVPQIEIKDNIFSFKSQLMN